VTRSKWFLLLLVSTLFLVSILAKCLLLTPKTPPPGIPESWRRHRDVLVRFELWLPEDWEHLGGIRTAIFSIRSVAEGIRSPLLFRASGDIKQGVGEWITVRDFDAAFELYAPLTGEELARECSKFYPVVSTLPDFDGVTYLDASNVVVIDQDESRSAIAYQSDVLIQGVDKDLVRTIACVVSRNHVYQIHLDTLEEEDDTNTSTYERILRAFRVLR
jgi:hypothetical protein